MYEALDKGTKNLRFYTTKRLQNLVLFHHTAVLKRHFKRILYHNLALVKCYLLQNGMRFVAKYDAICCKTHGYLEEKTWA